MIPSYFNTIVPAALALVLSSSTAMAVSASFAVTDSWSTGFNGGITITNDTAVAVTGGWTLEFDFTGTITNVWNSTLSSHVGTHYVVQNVSYNTTIPAGGTVFVGLTANPANPAQPPSNYIFKGVPLAGAPPPAISINDVSVNLAALPPGSVYLSTSGNQIVDAAGNPVRVTGINWFGFETGNRVLHGLWTRGYKSALDQIKGLGFNTLRIPYSNAMLRAGAATTSINFSQNPDLQGLTPLQCLDKVIDYCGQIGLRVFLDRHSSNADGYLNEDLWYISGDAYYTEQRWIDDWVMLATRYAGNPTVIGADLFNEPKRTATWGNSAPLTNWNKAAERCGNAILAANPNWLIIVEGVEKFNNQSYWWGGNLKGVATFPVTLNVANKLVYSIHDYPASVSAQTWFSAGNYPQNLGGVWDGYWGYVFKNNTAPVLVGEFGSKLATVSDQQWMDKLTDYMDGDFDLNGSNDLPAGKKGISWTMWCFNPNSSDTGGIVGDDWTTVNQIKLGYIQASMAPLLGGGMGGQTATFTVTLSSPPAGAVSVAWATANGTAVAGTDFTAASGTLNFAASETSKTIVVPLLPNAVPAGNKSFTVVLSGAVAATLGDGTGVGTLVGAPPWQSWRNSKFTTAELADSSITGPAADPDHDGISNLLEYALALEPKTTSQTGLPASGTLTISGKTHATLSFTRPHALTDITYLVEVSTDLQTWNSGPGYAIRTDDASTDLATFREVAAIEDTPIHFLRLHVTQP